MWLLLPRFYCGGEKGLLLSPLAPLPPPCLVVEAQAEATLPCRGSAPTVTVNLMAWAVGMLLMLCSNVRRVVLSCGKADRQEEENKHCISLKPLLMLHIVLAVGKKNLSYWQ